MIVLDTSVWIEFLKQNPEYTPKVKELLENREVLAVECIFGELLQGAKSKREIKLLMEYWKNLPKCSSLNLWIDAGKYSSENKLFSKGVGIIDCAIVLAARRHYAKIWSIDKKFNNILDEKEKFVLLDVSRSQSEEELVIKKPEDQ